MYKEIKILKQHGIQYVPNLRTAKVNDLFRGRPEIDIDITPEEELQLQKLCPTDAFSLNPFQLNLAKCVFCKECALTFPKKITFTNDYKIATNSLKNLIIHKGSKEPIKLDTSIVRPEVQRLFKHSLKLRQVSAGGDNSCEMELNAAGNVNFDMGRFGIEFVASPRHADGIVITGPISENMSEALEICYHATPKPKVIILAGNDAISGGIFNQNGAINRDFLNKYPIDLYVPGNPMHPLTFINGILDLITHK